MLAGLGAVAALGLFEGSLQIFSHSPLGKVLPAVEPQLGQPDPDIGYAFTPDMQALWTRENRAFVSINSLGFRDRPVETQKPAGVYRVALSGDSFVEALQVETDKVFENIAEDSLKSKGRQVEIVNLAMSGNGPLRQLVRLEKFGAPLTPDLTIMMISADDFLTGELQDDSENPGYKLQDDGSIQRGYGFRQRFSQRYADKLPGQIFLSLIHHSHTFRMLYAKRSAAPADILGLPTHGEDTSQPHDVCEAETLQKLHDLWVGHKPQTDWTVAAHFFQEAKTSTPERLMIALYVPIPDSDCAAQQDQRKEIIKSMEQVMSRQKIEFIDWNSKVAAMARTQKDAQPVKTLYGFGKNLGQGHMNYRGHEVYAQVLADVIGAK